MTTLRRNARRPRRRRSAQRQPAATSIQNPELFACGATESALRRALLPSLLSQPLRFHPKSGRGWASPAGRLLTKREPLGCCCGLTKLGCKRWRGAAAAAATRVAPYPAGVRGSEKRRPGVMLILSLGDLLVFLLFLWKPLLSAALEESSLSLPAPQNLTIRSYNFQNTLSWSPVKAFSGLVFYRVQLCLATDRIWRNITCRNNTKPECDFDIKDFYRTILRVRAEQGELKSEWTESPLFIATRDTILGPPRAISVSSEANSILISFLPPFDHKMNFSLFEYTIYWEKSANKSLITGNTVHRLKNLEENVMYCFRIQAKRLGSSKGGEKSDVYCTKTTITETSRILFGVLIFAGVGVLLVLIFLLLIFIRKYRLTIKSLLLPPITIPSHFKEDLDDPQMIAVELFENCAGEYHWDAISIVSNTE